MFITLYIVKKKNSIYMIIPSEVKLQTTKYEPLKMERTKRVVRILTHAGGNI